MCALGKVDSVIPANKVGLFGVGCHCFRCISR